MKINDLLNQLRVEYRLIGDGIFDTCGLLQSDTEEILCSFLQDKKYLCDIKSKLGVLLVSEENSDEALNYSKSICIVDNPRDIFFKLHNLLCSFEDYVRPYHLTQIDESAKISQLASIAPNNVIIGKNAIIEDFVSIQENTIIGDGCIVRSGSVVGGQGFEYKKTELDVFHVNHVGGVKIGDNVAIHNNTVINRAIYPWDDTIIGDHSKIDGVVFIAHGVKIGRRALIVAGTSIAGRTVVGDDAWIGAGATIRNGVRIGVNSRANMGAVVTKNVMDGEAVTGNFAINHKQFIENLKNK